MAPVYDFKIWRENNVLVAIICGSWSKLSAQDFANEFKQAAAPLTGQPWAHIVYMDDWNLGVPEIEPVVQELVTWCINNNLRYAAQVHCPNMVKRYQIDRMVIEKSDGFERRIFPEQQPAFAWLASLGFHTKHTKFSHQAG